MPLANTRRRIVGLNACAQGTDGRRERVTALDKIGERTLRPIKGYGTGTSRVPARKVRGVIAFSRKTCARPAHANSWQPVASAPRRMQDRRDIVAQLRASQTRIRASRNISPPLEDLCISLLGVSGWTALAPPALLPGTCARLHES